MSLNVSNVCRICLMSLANRKYFNLFVSPGRSQQLSAKIMACAWVQLMEGDGLPCHICCKCHDTLEVAYQFKQLCESSDVQLRQFFGRNKSNSLDLAQELRDCAADFKPINFNMSSERLELPPCELSLNTLRFLNQDMPFVQNLQLGLPDQPCDTKAEPGYHTAVHQPIQFSASLLERPLDQCSGFKSGSCVDGESFFSTIQAKLLEAVSETLSNAIPNELNDNRLVAWDLQNKQPLLPIPEKTLNELSSAIGQKIHEDDGKEDSLSFLEETRCILAPVKNICNSFENEPRLSKETEAGPSGNTSREGSPMPNISETDKFKGEEAAQGESKEPSNNKVREQCELCGKVFRYRGYVQLHMRTHTDERPHTCNICKQTFSMQHVLVTHMRTHSGDKPYICAECGKGFSQSSGLKLHMRSHSGDKPYQCEICSRKFAQSSNLKSHKLTHSGQRDHVCKICNRAFKFLKHLRSHQKTHYDHKEFKCPICTKSFIRKSYLETHISIHRGSKPFRCDACGQAFSSASNLRTHARIHSGLKPYTCQICKKNFTQSNTLKRHLKQHRLLGTPQLVPSS